MERRKPSRSVSRTLSIDALLFTKALGELREKPLPQGVDAREHFWLNRIRVDFFFSKLLDEKHKLHDIKGVQKSDFQNLQVVADLTDRRVCAAVLRKPLAQLISYFGFVHCARIMPSPRTDVEHKSLEHKCTSGPHAHHLEQAQRRSDEFVKLGRMRDRKRIGVCLGGGGITGAMYEVGVLAAIEEHCPELKYDLVVGASTGACVATALAGGIPAVRMYRALLDPSDDFFPLRRHHLMKLDLSEMRRGFRTVTRALRRLAGTVTESPLKRQSWHEVDRLWDSLPAGLFTMDAFEQFFFDFLTRRGIAKRFEDLPTELLLVANDLDEGQRVVLGKNGDLSNVPIAKAVSASMAIPMLYAPVRLEGRDLVAGGVGEAGHVDLAVTRGCDLVLMINAMVPVRSDREARNIPTGHGPQKRVRDKGMLWVYNQSWRQLTEARLERGLELFRRQNEKVLIELIEPAPGDATMFMHSPMNFEARRLILEDGYTTTTRELRKEGSTLRTTLQSAGFQVTS